MTYGSFNDGRDGRPGAIHDCGPGAGDRANGADGEWNYNDASRRDDASDANEGNGHNSRSDNPRRCLQNLRITQYSQRSLVQMCRLQNQLRMQQLRTSRFYSRNFGFCGHKLMRGLQVGHRWNCRITANTAPQNNEYLLVLFRSRFLRWFFTTIHGRLLKFPI
jgi:hypothetical protein